LAIYGEITGFGVPRTPATKTRSVAQSRPDMTVMPAKTLAWTAPLGRDRMMDSRSPPVEQTPYLKPIQLIGGSVVKLTLRDKESAQEAVRRFRKLVERSGIKKEMRIREFYEKPSETKRRARLRAQRRARRDRLMPTR
jgi:small subunit ribosomal protein S21